MKIKIFVSVILFVFLCCLFVFDLKRSQDKDALISALEEEIIAKDNLNESKDKLILSIFECSWNKGVNSGIKYSLDQSSLDSLLNIDKSKCLGRFKHISQKQ